MSAPTRATAGLAAALLLSAPLLGACGAGRTSVTAHERAAIDGAQVDAGDLRLRNVHLQAPASGEWAAGSDVPLALYLINRGAAPDRLLSVAPVGIPGTVTLSSSAGAIAGNGMLRTGVVHTQGVAEAAAITFKTGQILRPGQTITLTFTFERAGAVSVAVPVATS